MNPIISVKNLNKAYGKLKILNDLNLDIYSNQKVSIIGPSGSGKSTLLRLIMTLERPTSGVIEIEGERLWQVKKGEKWVSASTDHVRRLRQKVGMVFQHFNLFPHMTVLENVMEAPISVKKLPKNEAKKLATYYLEKVGLEDKLQQFPARLSGGQKQRVGIARALAMEPQIMLFDEITSALDPELTTEVLAILRKLAKETNMTMLLVTHEMEFSQNFSDRVLFFDEGKILEDGSPDKVFKNPENKRTQEFLQSFIVQ